MNKIFKEIKQGSDEWKEIRWGKIGSSTAGKLMTKLDKSVNECAEFDAILSEKMEDFDPFAEDTFLSKAMQRGNDYEPLARKEFCRIYGHEIAEYGWIEQKNGLVGISPDGWNENGKFAIEIKCPEGKTHVSYLRNFNNFLETYTWQIVHYFLVLDVETLFCISYRPENKLVPIIIFPVTKETRINISKKENYSISELVVIENKRLNEVSQSIETELLRQKLVNSF